MEAAQRKSKRTKLVIHDNYMHAVALKLLLQTGEYATETQELSKLTEDEKTCSECKTTFREAYGANRRAEAAREGGKNLLAVPLYLERHLKNPTGNYGGKNTKR